MKSFGAMRGGVPKFDFPRKHDVILRYAGKTRTFNVERKPYGSHAKRGRRATDLGGTRSVEYNAAGTPINCWWPDIKPLINWHSERLGYPTQKPLALLRRIIKVSSNENDLVLDPFCGCGTTIHAAEELNRKWIGIDISTFSVGLMRKRILDNFPNLKNNEVRIIGAPIDIGSAKALVESDRFEFEKWVCGEIGAHGMFKEVGTKGPDKGVDGVICFPYYDKSYDKPKVGTAIVQVKSGKVSPPDVGRLYNTVSKFEAKAGVLVCFEKFSNTVETERVKSTFKSVNRTFSVIQGFSIEKLLKGKKPDLPHYEVRNRQSISSSSPALF